MRRYAATFPSNSLKTQGKVRSGGRSGEGFCSATKKQVTSNSSQVTGTPKPNAKVSGQAGGNRSQMTTRTHIQTVTKCCYVATSRINSGSELLSPSFQQTKTQYQAFTAEGAEKKFAKLLTSSQVSQSMRFKLV